jgi:Cytochrome c oxidase subunit IV
MKVETWLFGSGVVFFTPIAIVYGLITQWKEPVGVVAIALTAGLGLLIGVYLFITSRRIDPRPEDDPLGEIAQGAGELGEFSPYSWAPLFLGFSAAVVFLGLAVGWWLFFIGAALSALALVIWVYEYFVGEHAH